jgi:hypothetical protein
VIVDRSIDDFYELLAKLESGSIEAKAATVTFGSLAHQ